MRDEYDLTNLPGKYLVVILPASYDTYVLAADTQEEIIDVWKDHGSDPNAIFCRVLSHGFSIKEPDLEGETT